MEKSLTEFLKKKNTLIKFDEAVPVTDINLIDELSSREAVVAVLGNADLYVRITRGDKDYLITWLDNVSKDGGLFDEIQSENLIFTEQQITLLGSAGIDIIIPWLFDSNARTKKYKEIMERLIGYLERGYSVEGFIEAFGDEF